MSKENFLENFELYVKSKIQDDFAKNKYIDFALDFETLLQNYFSSFIENKYYIEILAKDISEKIFAEDYWLISNLEKFNSQYHVIAQKFELLIFEIDEQNVFNFIFLDLISKKIDNCKKTTN